MENRLSFRDYAIVACGTLNMELNYLRDRISQGKDVYWLTPGWMKYRHYVYQGWDKGLANENSPKHTGGAIMLDAIGYYDKVMENELEKILEFSDWMGIPIQAYKVSLDRLKSLLLEQIK
jgi:hypothetical protein